MKFFCFFLFCSRWKIKPSAWNGNKEENLNLLYCKCLDRSFSGWSVCSTFVVIGLLLLLAIITQLRVKYRLTLSRSTPQIISVCSEFVCGPDIYPTISLWRNNQKHWLFSVFWLPIDCCTGAFVQCVCWKQWCSYIKYSLRWEMVCRGFGAVFRATAYSDTNYNFWSHCWIPL